MDPAFESEFAGVLCFLFLQFNAFPLSFCMCAVVRDFQIVYMTISYLHGLKR